MASYHLTLELHEDGEMDGLTLHKQGFFWPESKEELQSILEYEIASMVKEFVFTPVETHWTFKIKKTGLEDENDR